MVTFEHFNYLADSGWYEMTIIHTYVMYILQYHIITVTITITITITITQKRDTHEPASIPPSNQLWQWTIPQFGESRASHETD